MTGQEAVAYIHSFQWQRHAPAWSGSGHCSMPWGTPSGHEVRPRGRHQRQGQHLRHDRRYAGAAGYRVGLNTSPYLEDFRSASKSTAR